MQNPDNFNLFYNQTLQPELQRLDNDRLKLIKVLGYSFLALIVLVVIDSLLGIFVLTMIMSIPVVLYFISLFNRIRTFVNDFKPKIVRLILDFIDDGLLFGELRYQVKGFVPLQTFIESGIFVTNPAEYEGEDYIEGRIGDIEFEMCELRVREFSRVRPRLDEVFKGIFVRAQFVHPPKGALLLLPKASLPLLSQTSKIFVAAGGNCVDNEIDFPEFTNTYTVYASKKARISDLLPRELMESLLKLQPKSGNIILSFYGKNIYAAIPNNKDILEPKFLKSNVSYQLVREFYDDIYLALNLIIEFDKTH